MRSMKRVLSLLLVLSMIFAMVPSFAMAAEGEELGVTTEVTPVETTPVEETPAEEPKEESLETLATYEATFWTGEAADQPVNCATLREALNKLNENSRTRTGKEVITLLKNVDIANRADGIYFKDGSGDSATYAIYVDQGGFTLDLGGYTVRTSAGFMQTYNTTSGKSRFKTFTTDALKTVTVKNGTVITSVEGIDANQTDTDKAGRSMINHQAGNLTFENIKLLGSYQNNILMNPKEEGLYGTFNVIGCELFAPGSDSGASVINVNKNNTVNIVDTKIGMQGKDAVVKFSDSSTCNISGDSTIYYYGDGCFTGSPVLPAGKAGKTGTGSYTTSTGLVLTDAKTWTVADAVNGTLAAGFTADGGSEVKYYFNTALTEDNTADKIYTTAEKALAAALTAWDAAGKGTVSVYTDIDLADATFPGAANTALAHVGKDDVLTLTLAEGVDITDANATGSNNLLYVDDNAKVTINGGTFAWSKAPFIDVTNKTDVNFTGSITFNAPVITATNGASVVMQHGKGGEVTFNGGTYTAYKAGASGSGFVYNITTEPAVTGSTTIYCRGGAEFWGYQFTTMRVGKNSKVYAENCIAHANAKLDTAVGPKESSIRDDQLGCWGLAGNATWTTKAGTAYTGNNVVLGSADGTVESEVTITAAANRPQFPGSEADNTDTVKILATTVTFTPKKEAVASYTPEGGTETQYETLTKALDAMYAAQGGGTVKLLKDVDIAVVGGKDYAASTGAYGLDFKYGFTFDLNGKTLKISEGGIRLWNGASADLTTNDTFKLISSAATMGTLITSTNTTNTSRVALKAEANGGYVQIENVAIYGKGQGVTINSTVTEKQNYVKDSVIYSTGGAALSIDNSNAITVENSVIASSSTAVTPIYTKNLTIDGDSVVYATATQPAVRDGATVTAPTGTKLKEETNATFKASDYFTGMADATGLKKCVWAKEEMPAGTVATFIGADGVRHIYGIKETSGVFELTVDGVVDATTYAASYTDKATAEMFALGLAFKAAYAVKMTGALTLYADVTVDISKNSANGGVLESNGGTGWALLCTYTKGAEFVLNLNDHTLKGKSTASDKVFLAYVNEDNKYTINGGMDGVEGTDSNGNKIVGGGVGKIEWDTYLFRYYGGAAEFTMNGADYVSSAEFCQLRDSKHTGSININGGKITAKYLTTVQSVRDSMSGSTLTVTLDKGLVLTSNSVYSMQLFGNEMLYPYDCTIYLNYSSTDPDKSYNYKVESYVARWLDSETDTTFGGSTTSDLRGIESMNVFHAVTKETAQVKHVFTRGSAVATYKTDEAADAVTCYSWKDAVDLANENKGGIVTLLTDWTEVGDYDGGKKWVTTFKYGTTVDLGGHTLKLEDAHGLALYASGSGKTVIKNGTIICDTESSGSFKGGGYSALYVYDKLDLTLDNVYVSGPTVAVRLPGNDSKTYTCKLTINNSTLVGLTYGAVVEAKAHADLDISVSNSTFVTHNVAGIFPTGTNCTVDLYGINHFYYPAAGDRATGSVTSAGLAIGAKATVNLKDGITWSETDTRDFDVVHTFTGGTETEAGKVITLGKGFVHKSTGFSGGFTYTTAAGETTWFAELGASTGMNKDNGTTDSAFEALYNDPNGGGTITFFQSVFYGDKAKYGDTEEVTLADGTKEMAKVDSIFVDKNVSNGYIFNSTKDYTIDLNGHGMFMCDEAISTSNYSAVVIGLQTNNKTSKVEMKDGTIVWAGQKRPFCLGTSSAKDSAYTLTMTDVFYENKGSSTSSNEAFYVQDKSTIILDGGSYKDNGNSAENDSDGIICVNDNDRAGTIILKNGVVLKSSRNCAISLKGDDDVLKIESDLGATIIQAKKADSASDMIAGSGSVNIGTLTYTAPKESAAPYKHEVKLVKEVAYYFAPNADTTDLTKGTGFASFKEAFAKAMQDGGTVKLIKDIDLFSEYAVTELPLKLVDGTKPITIDLNEFSIYCSKNMAPDGANTTSGWKNFIYLYGDASLAIKNGTFKWSGSTIFTAKYDEEASKQWTGKLEFTDVALSNIYAGKCIGLESSAGEVVVSGGSIMSRNAPFTTSAKNADNTAKVTLKDGVVIETYSAYSAYDPDNNTGCECFAFRMSEAAPYESKMTISLEDAVIWSQHPEKGKIATPGFEDQIKLAPGTEFFISANATEKTFEYMGDKDGRTGNVYMHSVSVAIVEYTNGAGVTTKYSDLYSAGLAMNAYYSAQANKGKDTNVGTIKLLADVEIDEGTPMDKDGIFVNNAGTFTIDLNGHTISTAEGYTMDRNFMIQTNNALNATIQNGNIVMKSTSDIVMFGNSTMSPDADIAFKYLNVDVQGGGSFVNSKSNETDVTFDGGFYSVHSATGSKSFVFRTTKKSTNGDVTTNFYLKGGAVIEQRGWHGYALTLTNVNTTQVHIYDASITTYGSYVWSSGQLELTGALYNKAGERIQFTETGDAFKTAFMKYFTRRNIQPSIYTDSGYTTSYNLCVYNVELGTAEQQADSVAKSEATGLYYNVEDLLNYMGKLSAADTITAVADIDTTKTQYGQISGNATTLTTDNAITYELGSFTLTADIAANETLTINGGAVNGDVTAASGITATNTTMGGDLTVNGGEMSLTGSNVRGDLVVNAAGAHLISGGTIAAATPVELAKDVILTVADNATIDGSNGAAAKGEGGIIFKEAVVKFKTGTEPYAATLTVEGFPTDSDNGTVTTRTYTKAGDPVQGTNVAMLVENETYFATIKAAHDAASKLTGETVKLVADTTEPAFTIDRAIVIDLGEFKAVTEITATSEGVEIANGTIATANGDAVTVTDGVITMNDVTVSATGSALVVNGANANAYVYTSTLTGDTDSDETGYAIDVQTAANVLVSETTILTGAANNAGIAVGANVAYEVVTVESGEIYIPKAYYETTRQWAEGQDKITCLVNTVSRYAYDMTVENAADATNVRKSFYVASAAAPAAMIGKVGYATLKEAVAAANAASNAEIVLMRDIYLDEDYADTVNPDNTTSTYLVYLKKSMTIDYNGFTIYGVDSGKYGVYSIASGTTVTMKNGSIVNLFPSSTSSTRSSYTIMNSGNLHLDNVNITAYNLCLSSSGSTANAKFYINGGTFVSTAHFAAQANSPSGRAKNPEFYVSGGATFITKSTSSTYPAGINAQYTAFIIEDAYVYYNAAADATKLANALPKVATYVPVTVPEGATSVQEIGSMAEGTTLIATYTAAFDGKDYTVNYYGKGYAAKVGDENFASVEAAITAATADNKSDAIVLLTDAQVKEAVVLPAGETLDLAGFELTFAATGSMELNGEIKTNGGSLVSNGEVAVKSGAKIDGYTYTADALLNTALTLKAVSLSLNEYVDVNLKFTESEIASFNTVAVTANGTAVALKKTANGYNVYTMEDLKPADFATAYTVIMTGNNGNDACVGLPKVVSVKEYAKKVVGATDYGYDSDLGMTMTAMMDYAGVNVGTEFPGNVHTNMADTGTMMSTNNGVLSVAGDFTNGYALKVTSTTAGTVTVAHTDVYGTEFTQPFTVAAGETVTYTMMHVADAKQTVTITLTVDGTETSKLETTLASAAKSPDNDKAIVVSNLAEKFFTGK